MENYKNLTPINGVIAELEKQTNTIGMEMAEGTDTKKNEGVCISEEIVLSGDMNDKYGGLERKILKGTKIKFTEGYPLDENFIYVPIDKIIGIYQPEDKQ